MEFEKKAAELYNTMKSTDLETLLEQAKMYLQEKLHWDRNRVIVWDPDKIEFQVPKGCLARCLLLCARASAFFKRG